MRAKSMILIVIALGCGLVASIGISQVMDRRGNSTSEAKVETAKIFVTQTDVLLNEVITAQMIKLEDWPKDKVPEGAISKLEEVVGQRPKVRLYPGEPILKAKFVAGDTPTELIPAGFRVVPVKVSTDSISGGLVLPGDRVDVLVFLRRGAEIAETQTKTILRDVRVFAVNSQVDRSEDRDGSAVQAKTVSLLVKPAQVESLMLATELGKIKLSLRRADDTADEGSQGASIHEIIAGRGEKAEDKNIGIPSALAQVWPTAMPPEAPKSGAFRFRILTPTGYQLYEWDEKANMPREVTIDALGSSSDVSSASGAADLDPTVDAPTSTDTDGDADTSPLDLSDSE